MQKKEEKVQKNFPSNNKKEKITFTTQENNKMNKFQNKLNSYKITNESKREMSDLLRHFHFLAQKHKSSTRRAASDLPKRQMGEHLSAETKGGNC